MSSHNYAGCQDSPCELCDAYAAGKDKARWELGQPRRRADLLLPTLQTHAARCGYAFRPNQQSGRVGRRYESLLGKLPGVQLWSLRAYPKQAKTSQA